MIITKTPLRISFFCGGSDMESFYDEEPGYALSATIDKFVYVMVNEHMLPFTKVIHDEIENGVSISSIQHRITRCALEAYAPREKNFSVAQLSDVPSGGSGLGASSAYTVGLLKALTAARLGAHYCFTPYNLAEEAFEIERHKAGYHIGKQDPYAAAFGGFNLFSFTGRSTQTLWRLKDEFDSNILRERLLLIYTGYTREDDGLLEKYQDVMSEKRAQVRHLCHMALEGMTHLREQNYDAFGALLGRAWEVKRNLISSVSSSRIDAVYDKARRAGATGGKLLGAGNGGFMILYVPEWRNRQTVIDSIKTVSPNSFNLPFIFYSESGKTACV